MASFMNDKPFSHTSSNGTHFKADRCDLLNGVEVEKPEGINEVALCSDFAQFAAYHAGVIHENLNGFAGYDNITYTITETSD